MHEGRTFNLRQHERFALAAMYTSVEAHRSAQPAAEGLAGHAYDISESGVRLELDEPLPTGESVDLRLSLPGEHNAVSVVGDVVWVNDAEDDPGPRRMALRFTSFAHEDDRDRLVRFLGRGCPRVAA
jgi:hypothetical protein